MTMLRILAIVLIILGVLGLAYQGFSYVMPEKVAEVGPLAAKASDAPADLPALASLLQSLIRAADPSVAKATVSIVGSPPYLVYKPAPNASRTPRVPISVAKLASTNPPKVGPRTCWVEPQPSPCGPQR